MTVDFISTGYCTGSRHHVHSGQARESMRFHALVALIHHRELGHIIFDTGYAPRFYDATARYPQRLYAQMTPVYHDNSDSLVAQLADRSIDPATVDHLIISHFHADHIAGWLDLPDIDTWCRRSAWDHFNAYGKTRGLLSGYLPQLRQPNCHPMWVEALDEIEWRGIQAWVWTDDIYFVDLPGHSRGQVGVFLRDTDRGDILLAADGAWTLEAIRNKIYPSRMVSLFIDDYTACKTTIDHLHRLYNTYPDLHIVPSHCPEIARLYNFEKV